MLGMFTPRFFMSAKFVVAHMLAMLLLLSASTASATWLEDQARRVISGSRSIAFDNTTLFTPDASGWDNGALAALRGWRECSLDVECIAPSGSHRGNHRQDQAALTVLAWLHGLHATCTRQIVPLLTHVEAMQVRCAGDGGVGDGGGALEFGVAALVVALVCLACCGCWRGSECVERWVQGLPL
jgi:hypothetical protein